jgi:hypothetical protein
MLRLGMRRARVTAEWVNIWEDRAAAAAVRQITGGDETVPTVVVGTTAMVNPSARQVLAAARADPPGATPTAGDPRSRLKRAARALTRRASRPAGHVQQLSGAACDGYAASGRKAFPATALGIRAYAPKPALPALGHLPRRRPWGCCNGRPRRCPVISEVLAWREAG